MTVGIQALRRCGRLSSEHVTQLLVFQSTHRPLSSSFWDYLKDSIYKPQKRNY